MAIPGLKAIRSSSFPQPRPNAADAYHRCIKILENLVNQLVDAVCLASTWLNFSITAIAAFRWLSGMENV